jgi:tRNA A37 threonylcarbamoyladenosine synthetase subunit TsaC/SUA5/YrdC
LLDIKKIKDKELVSNIQKLPNLDIYKKVAFRVAHNFMHNSLIKQNGLLFLTSANKSDNPELFSSTKVKEEFKEELEKYNISIFAHPNYSIKSEQKSSDIFEFT